MRYIILSTNNVQGYCYTCTKCDVQCKGLFECVECPNVAYA